MSGVKRAACRAAIGVLCAALALLTGAFARTSAAGAVSETHCKSPGQVAARPVLFEHNNGPVRVKTLFLVCKPDRVVVIVDSEGHSYKDLDDFRAHNHLFTKDDKLSLPRNFPSIDGPDEGGSLVVSGHTSTSSMWWWLIGGMTLVLVAGGGGLLWWRARWRRSWAAALDTDPQEPSP